MSNQMPWQLNAGISFFPLSNEQVNNAQLGRLQGDWLANAQPPSLRQPSTDSSNSDPSKHAGTDALTLKEKNRRAQRKFREKQKVSTCLLANAGAYKLFCACRSTKLYLSMLPRLRCLRLKVRLHTWRSS